MLKESEGFINKLGHQVALEQLTFVEKEVDRAYQRVQDEKAKVLDFQNKHNLISPNRPAQHAWAWSAKSKANWQASKRN